MPPEGGIAGRWTPVGTDFASEKVRCPVRTPQRCVLPPPRSVCWALGWGQGCAETGCWGRGLGLRGVQRGGDHHRKCGKCDGKHPRSLGKQDTWSWMLEMNCITSILQTSEVSVFVSEHPAGHGKMGEMGGNGGRWGKWGGNGKLLQINDGKCMKMFQQEREMEKNGVEMGGEMGERWDTQLLHFSRSHFSQRSPIPLQGPK